MTASAAAGLRLAVDTAPSDELVRVLQAGLATDDPAAVGPRDHRAFAIVLHDAGDRVVAGLLGATIWRWLSIDALWVEPALRGGGQGARLLAEAERHARGLGCADARVDTFDFQARAFYERHGYVVYGRLEGFPPGHTHFHMRKSLAATTGGAPAAAELAAPPADPRAPLPPELARQSVSSREIVLALDAAVEAVTLLAADGHRLEAWEGRLELPGGTRTHSLEHTGSFALPADAGRAAETAAAGMRRAQARFDRAPEVPGARLFFHLTFAGAAR